MIRAGLDDRCLKHVNLQIRSGTEAAVALVKKKIDFGLVPSFEEIISTLRSQGHEATSWRDFLDKLDTRDQPSTVGELGKLMYVFNAIRPALSDHEYFQKDSGLSTGADQGLVVQVDDINEWRILDGAVKILRNRSKRIDCKTKAIAIGLFPMQRVFLAGKGRSDLYNAEGDGDLYLDPNSNDIITALDIIKMTHGLHVGEQLQRLCLRAGFTI